MKEVWAPSNEGSVKEAVNQAIANQQTLEIIGSASKRALGREIQADIVLDMSSISGVVLYEPEELILIVAPSTPILQVKELLAQKNQYLPFDPPDFSLLWGLQEGVGTIGGAVMTGANGSRRLTTGGVRDHVLGVKGVNGFGEIFVAGGRVVKNVTGFDLPKLVAGSFGTLCAATQLTLKVLPRPPMAATLLVTGLTDSEAIVAMRRALNDISVQVSSAAHLPRGIVMTSTVTRLAELEKAITLIRVEGFGQSVTSGIAELQSLFPARDCNIVLDQTESDLVWGEVRNASFFAQSRLPLWHLSVPPNLGARVGERLCRELNARVYYDWAGGAVWLEVDESVDGGASLIRNLLKQIVGQDGRATLMRAPTAVRMVVSPLQPLEPGLAMLNERVRRQFDPQGILNPGRMYETRHAN